MNEILNEYLLYNRYIQVNESCVKLSTLGNKKSLAHKIIDIIDFNGQALKFDTILPKLLNQINRLDYYGIIAAVPNEWWLKLKIHKKYDFKVECPLSLSINTHLRPIECIKNNFVYWEIVQTKCQAPTLLETWIDMYPFLEFVEWSKILKLVYTITTEP